ncbi:hypothetical protein KHW15_01490 [Pseudomonas syringae]|jgi:hypothetical protein|uniref:hypothetical protein n=1 Tax=Pseudomonas TaxID=286 RepID=UPI001AE7CE8C|nr:MULTISPECIES: hypothetical protein [Pseudomonas]MBP1196253.1 hypothetical protein [Pseudomonas sp. PvP100]MBP1087915.1 hypothetical protein [Pseudomonas sp. PvP007]MBS7423019.1 hypothetical protein [Pseudomonas syringae]MBS7434756.1 hypothetical protein [Pseudomonas syringae]MDF5834870.1 hypothetical protein [Pseudomonas syringae]
MIASDLHNSSEQLPTIHRTGYPKNKRLTKKRFKQHLSEVDKMEAIVEEPVDSIRAGH